MADACHDVPLLSVPITFPLNSVSWRRGTLQHFPAPALQYSISLTLQTTFVHLARKGCLRVKQRVYILGGTKHDRISVYLAKHSSIKFQDILYEHHRKYN
jgi:hypothetical protein